MSDMKTQNRCVLFYENDQGESDDRYWLFGRFGTGEITPGVFGAGIAGVVAPGGVGEGVPGVTTPGRAVPGATPNGLVGAGRFSGSLRSSSTVTGGLTVLGG
jgi:hypothetical protein